MLGGAGTNTQCRPRGMGPEGDSPEMQEPRPFLKEGADRGDRERSWRNFDGPPGRAWSSTSRRLYPSAIGGWQHGWRGPGRTPH